MRKKKKERTKKERRKIVFRALLSFILLLLLLIIAHVLQPIEARLNIIIRVKNNPPPCVRLCPPKGASTNMNACILVCSQPQ